MKKKNFIRKLTLRRLFEGLFYAIEDHFPKLARLLRFHSVLSPFLVSDGKIETTFHIHWLSKKYFDQYRLLAGDDEFNQINVTDPEVVRFNSYIINDFYIDGHIKAPIRKSDLKILSLTHLSRLRWGDAFPQPVFFTHHLDGNIIFIPNIENYYHILVDHLLPALTRFIMGDEKLDGKIYFVTQRHLPILEFFISFLKSINIEAQQFKVRPFHRVTGNSLIVGRMAPRDSGCYYAYSNLIELFDNFIEENIKNIEVPKFVYIERTNTPRRRILNQIEIDNILQHKNFEKVHFNFQNYLYQIAVFRKARVIISVHGASLANLIWSKSSKVIEIFPQNLRPKNYLNIAAQQGLDYQALLGSPMQGREDFFLDTKDLIGAIEKSTE
jgi:hypothetical protein